jgi:uncharacterized protein (DUF4415 family)
VFFSIGQKVNLVGLFWQVGYFICHPGAKEMLKSKRGRPALAAPKEHVNIRPDADIVGEFKQTGAGWQTRQINALRDWLKTYPRGNAI